ncbi:hypothetical protein AAFF_G00167540 [Aldrovandia affinis]|uniref:Uncharacterized protein n=1 Tax=Aldrovandia affinis TaxID=143900 RepID=A0AAD7W7W4_9TELE|nr:hypothetical protein AAFF_G00167540 [Aldrovandia affinis]
MLSSTNPSLDSRRFIPALPLAATSAGGPGDPVHNKHTRRVPRALSSGARLGRDVNTPALNPDGYFTLSLLWWKVRRVYGSQNHDGGSALSRCLRRDADTRPAALMQSPPHSASPSETQ